MANNSENLQPGKMNIIKFFKTKKIIHSTKWQPGLLVKSFTVYRKTGNRKFERKKYVRIAFTNRIKYKGMWPITDVLFEDVKTIEVVPSPFKKWLYGWFGKEPKNKMLIIKRNNNGDSSTTHSGNKNVNPSGISQGF